MADGDVLKIVGGHQAFAAPTGGGGVTVDNQTDPPAEVTTIVAPGWIIDDSTATSGVVVSETDPGAIGAGNFWVRTDPSNSWGPMLNVRNAANDGWVDTAGSGSLLSLTYYDEANTVRSVVSGFGATSAEDSNVIIAAIDAAGVTRAQLMLYSSGIVRLKGLPTSDPAFADQLWVDVPAGRVLKVSAG